MRTCEICGRWPHSSDLGHRFIPTPPESYDSEGHPRVIQVRVHGFVYEDGTFVLANQDGTNQGGGTEFVITASVPYRTSGVWRTAGTVDLP